MRLTSPWSNAATADNHSYTTAGSFHGTKTHNDEETFVKHEPTAFISFKYPLTGSVESAVAWTAGRFVGVFEVTCV